MKQSAIRPATTSRRRAGDAAEARAASFLEAQGWTVLARNVRVQRGEIDLVALEPGAAPTLVLVEVRSAATGAFGAPEERVDARKVGRMYRAAMALIARGALPDGERLPRVPWRVDLVTLDDRASSTAVLSSPGTRSGGHAIRHLRGVAIG